MCVVLILECLIVSEYVHFIGIGGISMSGIAKVLLNNGIKVSGSDSSESETVKKLIKLSAEVSIGHRKENITNQDLVVYTSAVKDDNPEIIAAREKGIELIDRATMLGRIMKNYKNALSVAGTHGKTTVTSMMAYILIKACMDPTVMVGGKLDGIDGNLRIGKSDYFVTETCEYMRNFLKFFPTAAIILNVEEDHLDYYSGIDDIIDAFNEFAKLVPKDGFVVTNAESENALKSVRGINAPVYTFGFKNADFTAENIRFSQFGYPSFDLCENGNKLTEINLSIVGIHNVLNAAAAALAATKMGIGLDAVKAGLEEYTGTKRRFEKKGMVNGALIVDDYAHHPTEISATLAALKNVKHNHEWCIFQPHTYTRTHSLMDEFAAALSAAEHVIITDIFAAREKDTGLAHAKQLSDKIKNAVYIKDFDEIAEYIKANASEGDIILTMGAGNVCDIGSMLAE